MTILDDYDRIRTAMEYATGETLDTDHPCRTSSQFWMRAITAHFLYSRGWVDARIARLLGRCRAAIWCSRQRVQEAMELPKVYADVIEIMTKTKEQYYELFGHNL